MCGSIERGTRTTPIVDQVFGEWQFGLFKEARPADTLDPVCHALPGTALKTGNPAAVNSSFLLFFPFLFLTTSYVPKEQLSGWLKTVASWNPVTYLLEGLRALVYRGWDGTRLLQALAAVAIVGAISQTMCFAALRGRVKRG